MHGRSHGVQARAFGYIEVIHVMLLNGALRDLFFFPLLPPRSQYIESRIVERDPFEFWPGVLRIIPRYDQPVIEATLHAVQIGEFDEMDIGTTLLEFFAESEKAFPYLHFLFAPDIRIRAKQD